MVDLIIVPSLRPRNRWSSSPVDTRIYMVIKDLDLEPKIDAMMRNFLNSSRWEELSKETSSEILPNGDGSRG
nr:hypothetical protein [Tanacetum cinerariifolium]GEV77874.1 hypothetical protein [Tanacetum cinerariifolium]